MAGGDERRTSRLLGWVDDNVDGPKRGTRPEDFDPDFVRAALRRMRPLYGARASWFRPVVQGWTHVPDAPVLIVSNHSGGTSIPDAWGLFACWYRHFGLDRPIHVLAHEMVFLLSATADPFSRLGVLRAERDMALRVLTEFRRDLAVMPGGDVEVYRPWSERYRVDFAGRRGYARLALRARVPIVPVANAGAHETLVVLSDGRRLAEVLQFKRLFRANIFPVHLSMPWGLAIGPLPHLPAPVQLRYRVGKPIAPPSWPEGEPSDEEVDALDVQVRASIQELLDQLAAEEPNPVRRKLRAVFR